MSDSEESARVAALHRLNLLDTPATDTFDQVTRLTAAALSVPIVLVSLVDEKRQWFKSRVGLDSTETPRAISFCAHAVTDRSPLVVRDATQDIRFANNPMVTGVPYVRAYAGIPLYTREGYAIGALCAIDRKPRNFTAVDLHTLRDAAKAIEDFIHAEEAAAAADPTSTFPAGLEAALDEVFHAMRGYVKRHAEYEAAARAVEDRFRASSEYAPVLVTYWNSGLRCEYANQAHAYWLDQPQELLVGTSMQDALGAAFRQIEADVRGASQGHERHRAGALRVRDTCTFNDVFCLPDPNAPPETRGVYLVLLNPHAKVVLAPVA